MRILNVIRGKWADAPTKVSDLKSFIKGKNMEVDAIGTSDVCTRFLSPCACSVPSVTFFQIYFYIDFPILKNLGARCLLYSLLFILHILKVFLNYFPVFII